MRYGRFADAHEGRFGEVENLGIDDVDVLISATSSAS